MQDSYFNTKSTKILQQITHVFYHPMAIEENTIYDVNKRQLTTDFQNNVTKYIKHFSKYMICFLFVLFAFLCNMLTPFFQVSQFILVFCFLYIFQIILIACQALLCFYIL